MKRALGQKVRKLQRNVNIKAKEKSRLREKAKAAYVIK